MKIEDLRAFYVVHSVAAVTLLGTMALFGYEVSKPQIQQPQAAGLYSKYSPMSAQPAAPETMQRLGQLPERFRHKVLVYAVHRKKFLTPAPQGKPYMAMKGQSETEASGNQ